jgi:hypothetical protein
VTLEEAKQWLRERVEEGAHCPCCGQFAKVYRRRLNSGMARSLITMYRRGGHDWMHIPTTIPAKSREEGKLAYWQLVEESDEPRDDGGRAGWWRVTDKGTAFIYRHIRVPKYALVYDATLLGLDGSETVNIQDCLGDRFDLSELMGA